MPDTSPCRRILLVASVVGAITACSTDARRAASVESRGILDTSFADHLPINSPGRRPAGTRQDPFVGIGVIKTLIPMPAEALVRVDIAHRAIPWFKSAMEMGVYVPPEIVATVGEGDFVRLFFAKAPEGSRAAIEYDRAMKAGPGRAAPHRPHVWFGYELFKIESIPDADFSRSFGPSPLK